MKLHIIVTEDDIESGIPIDGHNCPIALALHRKFPDIDLEVQAEYIDFVSPTQGWDRADLPLEAKRFVQDFDHNDPVVPFDFWLEIKSRLAELLGISTNILVEVGEK